MKSLRLLLSLMVAATIISCEKIEEIEPVNPDVPDTEEAHSVFRIGAPEIGPNTKMSLGPVDGSDSEMVLWELGDDVWIMRQNGDAGKFWANKILDGGKNADFYGLQFTTGGRYRAVYPASAITCWEDGPDKRYDSFKAAIPSVQKYVPNSFPKEANLSMAEWDEDKGEKRLMKNLAGAIRFNLTGNITVGYLELYSDGMPINGYYDMAKETFLPMPESWNIDPHRVILDCSYEIENEEGSKTTMRISLDNEKPTSFNIIVPPGTLSNGFQLSIYDSEGEWINTLLTTKDNTVERSSIVVMPTINVETEEKAGDPTLISNVNSVISNMLSEKNSSTRAVKHVVFETNSERTSDYVVSADGYLTKAYVDYDAETNTLYYSTAADQMYLTTANSLFYFYDSLEDITDLKNLNVSNVYDFEGMFQNCSKLTEIDLSPLNAAKAGSLNSMFEDCSSLKSVNLSGLGTESVNDMFQMFRGCQELKAIDLSGLNLNPDPWQGHLDYLFMNCYKLGHVKFAPDFSPAQWNYSNMFQDAGYLAQDKTMYIDCSYAFQAIFKDCENSRYEGRWSAIGSYGPKGSETLENTERVVNYVFKDVPTALYDNITFNKTAKALANSSNVMTKSGANMTKESIDNKIKHIKYDIMSSVPCPYSGEYNFMDWNEDSGTITVHFTSDRIYNVGLGLNDAEGMFQNMAALEDIDNLGVFEFSYDVTSFASMFKGCSSLRELYFYDTAWDGNIDLSSYDFTGFIDGVGSAIGKTTISCSRALMKAIVAANPSASSSVIWDTPDRVYTIGVDPSINHTLGEKIKALANDIEIVDRVLSSVHTTSSASPKYYPDDAITDNLIRHIVFTKGGHTPDYHDASIHWDELTATITVNYRYDDELKPFIMGSYDSGYVFQNFTALEDIEGLNLIETSWASSMEGMFSGCSALKSLDLSSFSFDDIWNLSYMFANCRSLTSLNLNGLEIDDSIEIEFENIINNAGIDATELTIKCSTDLRNAIEDNSYAGYNNSVNYKWDCSGPEVPAYIDLSAWYNRKYTLNTVIKNAVNGKRNMTDDSPDNQVKAIKFTLVDPSINPNPFDDECPVYAHFDAETGTVNFIAYEEVEEFALYYDDTFINFAALEMIDFNNTYLSNIINNEDVFDGCVNLKSIVIPDSIFETNPKLLPDFISYINNLNSGITILGSEFIKLYFDSSGISVSKFEITEPLEVFKEIDTYFSTKMNLIASNRLLIDMSETIISKLVFVPNCSELSDDKIVASWNEAQKTIPLKTRLNKFKTNYNLQGVFSNLPSLTSISGLEYVDFSNVKYLWNAFYGDESLTSLDLSHITSNIEDMDSAFYGCTSLQWLDLSGINTTNCYYLCDTFNGCENLSYLRLGENFIIPENDCNYDDMLKNAAISTADKTLNVVCSDATWNQLTSMDLGLDSGVTLNRIPDSEFLAAKNNVTTTSMSKSSVQQKRKIAFNYASKKHDKASSRQAKR